MTEAPPAFHAFAGSSTPAMRSFGDIAPVLAAYTDGMLFSEVWQRPQLSPRDRSIITVAALVAMSRTNEMPIHLRFALHNGVTKDELVELVTHLAFYAGWPASVTAVDILRKTFQEEATG